MALRRLWIACVTGLAIGWLGTSAFGQPPVVTSANLTARFDAGDINNDNGATNPLNGNDFNNWSNLVGGQTLNGNFPTDGRPSFIAAGSGGIGNQPTVRFEATAAGGDLLFNNSMNFGAQTVFAALTMPDNGTSLSTLFGDAGNNLNLRQTTSVAPAYFGGNSDDYLINDSTAANGGTLSVNGNRQLDIPGGFGAAHVVRLERTNATAFNGFRLSSNEVANRRWNGDIGEILVYDGTLSGDDTIQVNRYLSSKYGIAMNTALDERLNESKQIAVNPFQDPDSTHIGVNFHYGGPEANGTFNGIGFDNIDLSSAAALTDTYVLNANADTAGTTLTLNFNFPVDNTPRSQVSNITGTDSATLNTIANEIFYISNSPTNHPTADMLFEGLGANQDVFVQVIGGDQGWNGDIQVEVNGGDTFDWLGAADGGSTSSASLFGFFTQTNAAGQLDLSFTVPTGNFAGIGGVMLTLAPQQVVPEPTSLAAWGLLGFAAFVFRARRRRQA